MVTPVEMKKRIQKILKSGKQKWAFVIFFMKKRRLIMKVH
jgi:hypothetical protein